MTSSFNPSSIYAPYIEAGATYEIDQRQINGEDLRVYKNAPATLIDALAQGRQHGDKTFLVHAEQHFSFDEFYDAANKLALRLVEHYGLGKGCRLAIAMDNRPEWMIAFAAGISIGAVVVTLNTEVSTALSSTALVDAGPDLLLCDQRFLALLNDPKLNELAVILCADEAPSARDSVELWDSTQQRSGALPDIDISPGDLAVLNYTSGTTAAPKGTVSSHFAIGQALSNYQLMAQLAAEQQSDSAAPGSQQMAFLLALPLFNVSACYAIFLSSLLAGHKIVLFDNENAEQALKAIEVEQIDVVCARAEYLQQLVELPGLAEIDSSSLRVLRVAGRACPWQLRDRLRERLPAVKVFASYAITESNGACSMLCAEGEKHSGASGLLSPIVDCKICDHSGTALELGESGDIYLRSAANAQQYWNLPALNADNFVDGWLRTGDVGYLDADGFIYIQGRREDMPG